jgi:hypothetical protein
MQVFRVRVLRVALEGFLEWFGRVSLLWLLDWFKFHVGDPLRVTGIKSLVFEFLNPCKPQGMPWAVLMAWREVHASPFALASAALH